MKDPRDRTDPRINIDGVIEDAKKLILSYKQFVSHTPKMLRDSMMMSYQAAIDDFLKVLDANRSDAPVIHKDVKEKKIVLLDQNGHAT